VSKTPVYRTVAFHTGFSAQQLAERPLWEGLRPNAFACSDVVSRHLFISDGGWRDDTASERPEGAAFSEIYPILGTVERQQNGSNLAAFGRPSRHFANGYGMRVC
jgi:hypothetical protein